MRVLCLALVLGWGLSPLAVGADASWYNKHFVKRSAHRLAETLEDFHNAMKGVPGTQGLEKATDRFQTTVSDFEIVVDSAQRPAQTLKAFGSVSEGFEKFRHRVKGFHVREKSHFFVRDYFSVAEAYSRLEYNMTPATGAPGPGPGPKPTLKPIELRESFLASTGLYSPSSSDLQRAAQAAGAECNAWRDQVRASSAGKVVLAQCSGGSQTKGADGKTWVKVSGEVSLNFDNLPGMTQPTQEGFSMQVSTGLYSPSTSDIDRATKEVRNKCRTWAKELTQQSQGAILFVSCGSSNLVKGYDGKQAMELKASTAITWPLTKNTPRSVTNTFQASTGLYSPSTSDVERASQQAWDQCRRWVQDTKANSSARALLATCEGPTVVKPNKVEVQYRGKILLMIP